MHLVAGTSLKNGQYILNHILDQQGIGWTYRATQTNLNQTVLIKTLNPTLRSHPQFNRICQDFTARSRDLASLRHPSVVRVLDIFQDQAMPFVVMEYVQGIPVNDWITDRPRSEAEVIQFLKQMAQVLNYLQQHNYCHGNLKPRNIIYRHQSESNSAPPIAVLVGFAPSFLLSEMVARRNPYSAPELRSRRASDRSDLYSLSGILYYCLTQHPPLDEESQSDRLPLLSLLKPGAQRLLRSGTLPNPADRPKNSDLWLAQLSKPQPSRPRSALPENLPRYRTTPLPPPNVTPDVGPDLAESTRSRRISIKRLPSPARSYDRARSPKPGGSLFLPELRTVQIIATIGATLGLIFGIVLRFQAAQRPGASFFHTGQSFPAREWKGSTSPNETDRQGVFVEPNSTPPAPERSEPRP